MPIARMFLNWNRPALQAATDYLVDRYAPGQRLDMDQVVLVVPGGRAGRKLLELLADRADDQSLVFFPPEVRTAGAFPELLYESKRPFAPLLVQHLAWVRALTTVDPDRCAEYIPVRPAETDFSGWMELGALLCRQHRELAADALDFADVAGRGSNVPGFQESQRWEFFSAVQHRYLALLDELGLWDLQTARRVAIERRECTTNRDIILIATTDMNRALRLMLDQVADHVTALVHAPQSLAGSFDRHGCVLPDAWQDVQIDLATDQIRIVDGPDDQAGAVLDQIASFGGQYRADLITVGVPDELLVPQLERRLAEADVGSRWVVGKTLDQTPPYRLLETLAAYADHGRFTSFAQLVRHPDVSAWIESLAVPDVWLIQLDDYYNTHLPPSLGQWPGDAANGQALKRIDAALQQLIRPLRGESRSLGQWAPLVADLLRAFYGDRVFDSDEPGQSYTLQALDQIRSALIEQQQVPPALAPRVTARQAIELLLSQVRSQQIPSAPAENAIELLGWLELPLDMAPALIVTSFNEGSVPTSVNSDLFFPNALRQELGLDDNRRRYARDAYALSAIQASREQLTLVTGRRTGDNDPLVPSRLAFATGPETVARRANQFFRPPESPPKPIFVDDGSDESSAIVVPRPRPLEEPITSISVTSFRTYLACPYRFYLQHALKLKPVDDQDEELGPAQFGTMLHDVLGRFGEDKIRNSTDPDRIRRFLHAALNECVTTLYGSEHLPAVDVQIAQARARLDAFAEWQAARASDGWEIVHTETSGGDKPTELAIDADRSVTLRGRIDRIDRKQGEWAVLDYKTGDAPKTPQQTHLSAGNWVDLQLPLYQHVVASLGINRPVALGYVLLPKDVARVGESMADWDDQMLQQAEQVALEVATSIVDEQFWPPVLPPPKNLSDYAPVCQDLAFRARFEGVTGE